MNIPLKKFIGSWKTILLSFCILVPFQVKVTHSQCRFFPSVFRHPGEIRDLQTNSLPLFLRKREENGAWGGGSRIMATLRSLAKN